MGLTSTRILQAFTLLNMAISLLAAQSSASAKVAELEGLASQYKAEARAVLLPVQRRYVRRLKELKIKLTRADRLKDALEVKKEIERVESILASGPVGADVKTKDDYIHEGLGWKEFRVGATRKKLIGLMGPPDDPRDTRWLQWRRLRHQLLFF